MNNDRLCYINVDDSLDPLLELGRLVPLQLAWSLGGKRGPLVEPGKLEEAMTLADKLVRWAPKSGAHRIHQGFLAYLTGDKTKALEAFEKAQQLDPNAYRTNFAGAVNATATAAYKKVLEDKEFAARLPK